MSDSDLKETGFALMSFNMFGHSKPDHVPMYLLKDFFNSMKSFSVNFGNGYGLRWLENYSKLLFLNRSYDPRVVDDYRVYKPMFQLALRLYRLHDKNARIYFEEIDGNDRSFKPVNNWGLYCNKVFDHYSK